MTLAALMTMGLAGAASAADECRQRGQLDTLHRDADGDLVADAPTDTANKP
jgi:phosphonate transport system substrate-binding protein